MNGQGFAISKRRDAKAMYECYAQWANVMEITVTPCAEDAEAGADFGINGPTLL
jgi:Protein of unknown function (DUF3303)